ncbi:3TM-type holin [Methylibium sp. Root1272]|uniref:3TM-type holin n=1 Tax=Methylibium sp. Root1272 TaxID=1736441 RepID=UPI0006F87D04|nr:3TM-type holin [Methylibium sp. Root1272]KQW76584.1 hypothetical protein ASC67_02725 [Methylibium sp. Root1272]
MSPLAIGFLGDAVRSVLDRVFPDPVQRAQAEVELLKAQSEGTFDQRAAQALALAQIGVNNTEAASPGIFKGGWRPAAGWVCVSGLGVQFIAAPLLPWVVTVLTGKVLPPIPALDVETLLVLLGGLLGLGTLRTVDRRNGKA